MTSPSELGNFHNRLTHTLEVAQLSRRIAERFVASPGHYDLDPDVCEAAALIHDLGHPPFGHNGEKCLDALAKSVGYWEGYEGNAQSFRIVTKLARDSAGFPGLNLTVATLRASIKYPWMRAKSGKKSEKFGVYRADLAEFKRLSGGKSEMPKSLEAQVMDWADDVAYSTHDFYDFVVAGLIPIQELTAESGLWDRLKENVMKRDGFSKDELADAAIEFANSFLMIPRFTSRTSRLTSDAIAILKDWVSERLTQYAGAKLSISQTNGVPSLSVERTAMCEVALLKQLTYYFAIGSPALAARQIGERRILSTLFHELLASAKSKDPKLLSEDAEQHLREGVPPVRVVLDTISSSTDAQAINMVRTMNGDLSGSITEASTSSAA